MPIYILSAGSDATRAGIVERSIRRAIPDLAPAASIQEVMERVVPGSTDPIYLLIVAPTRAQSDIARLTEAAAAHHGRVFFILISDEISASDYKALVRTGAADWVSIAADPQEILEVIARHRPRPGMDRADAVRPVAVSFVPSAGGVGNTTLVVEAAIRLKTKKDSRHRNICIVDLDFQGSHVCDYLDIEPRLKIQEISDHPERLDAQLFEIFTSRHRSGVHVFAAPRSRFEFRESQISALDCFFNLASKAYDLIFIDLPTTWFSWTSQIVSASDGVVVTGMNSIPCLRQTAETLAAVRAARPTASAIAVAVNRCQRRLMGGVVNRHHVESVLENERIFYVGNEPTMMESVNTGTPLGLSKTTGAFGREIATIAAFCAELKSSRAGEAQ